MFLQSADFPLPEGWVSDARGRGCGDAGEVLANIVGKAAGGISPLGGSSELLGGHKGYGLALIVELFTGILAGGVTSNHVHQGKGETSHFFMALDYGIFGEKAAIKDHFARFLQELRDSPKASGEPRVFIHGEKETESRIKRLANGIPVDVKTRNSLREINDSCALGYKL